MNVEERIKADRIDCVDAQNGLISPEIFIDRAIYDRELEQIFAKCWLYLGHESQLEEPHDYFTSYMGEDSMLVTRDEAGRIRAFHNSCRHRGMTICRTDEGNANLFRCPYHAWTYSSAGKLVSVPRLTTGYGGELDQSSWGFIEVAQLDTFSGLIFATWDPDAAPLRDYLGDMAYYLTLMVNRHEAGAHVLRGGQKWLVPANWKIIAENVVGDLYHVSSLHESSVAVGFRAPMGNKGYEIHLDNGHGLGAEFGGTMQSENDQPIYAEYLNQVKDQVEQRHGKAARDIVPVGTSLVFPNLFVFDSMRFRLLWAIHPRGPEMTEIHSWSLVDNALPHEMKEEVGKQAALALGMFLVDDEDCWKEVMAGLRGVVGRRHPSNYQMGLGRDRAAADMFPGSGFPGKMAERFPDEGNQRNFYSCWQSLINGE